ncbi:MAG: hypothetical protein LBR89_04015 [Holosporales bacterium]|nr:hypothetical protein [Holosporales bacterium]
MSINDRPNVLMDQYEYLTVPGVDVRIPVVKRSDQEEHDTTGVRVPDWMVIIDGCTGESTLNKYEDYIELFGWYCESSRHVRGDSANNLRTSGTLWHSDVFLVMQNGVHNHQINTWINCGKITTYITIVRLTRVNLDESPEDPSSVQVQTIQELMFATCHWVGMYAYLDWSIARLTACERVNRMHEFKQREGVLGGNTLCHTSYAHNTVIPGGSS